VVELGSLFCIEGSDMNLTEHSADSQKVMVLLSSRRFLSSLVILLSTKSSASENPSHPG